MKQLLAALIAVLALAGCGDDDGGTSRVERVIDRYNECGLFTGDELDEQRDAIQEALDVLPADQHEEYLNDLYLEDDLCESASNATTPPTTEPSLDEPSSEVVAAWPEAWCSVEPGVTRDELVEVMRDVGLSETPESLSWDGFNYQFNAFLNVEGTVRQMDINTVMLSAEEVAELPCEETRVL